MTSLVPMPARCVTSPRRSLLPQTHVLSGRSTIDLPWLLLRGPNPRTPTTKNPVSPFGDLPSSPPTRPAWEINKGLKRSTETELPPPPLTGMIPVTRDSVDKTRSPKVPSPLAPLTEKVGGAEAVKAANRNDQLPVRGKLVHFKDTWTKLFPQHPEIVRKVSQGIFEEVLPSLLRYPLELPSNNKTADLLHAVQKLRFFAGHRGGDGHYVAGLLQPPFSSPKTRRFFLSHHTLEEVEAVHCSSIVQNGNTHLNNSSTSTTVMDHKDRLEGRIPSHPGTRQHPQILPVRCSRDSLSIPGPPVWTINSSTGIHQDSSPCDPAASFSRLPGPRLFGRLDNSCHFSRTESGTYTTHYTTSPITGMDNQLGQINVTTLQNPGLSGFTFQLRTGPHIPSGLVLTYSHQGPIPSISVDGHDCSESFIHHQADVTLCPC